MTPKDSVAGESYDDARTKALTSATPLLPKKDDPDDKEPAGSKLIRRMKQRNLPPAPSAP